MGVSFVLENSVTTGTLASKLSDESQELYQLSASVNKGNSGGPVFNSFGEVIGVVVGRAKDGEGIGFGIPLNDVIIAIHSAESLTVAEVKTSK